MSSVYEIDPKATKPKFQRSERFAAGMHTVLINECKDVQKKSGEHNFVVETIILESPVHSLGAAVKSVISAKSFSWDRDQIAFLRAMENLSDEGVKLLSKEKVGGWFKLVTSGEQPLAGRVMRAKGFQKQNGYIEIDWLATPAAELAKYIEIAKGLGFVAK